MINGNYFNYNSKYDSNNFYDTINCHFYSDLVYEESNPERQNFFIKVYNKCKRIKIMKALEYISFIIDFSLTILCIYLEITEYTTITIILTFISLLTTIAYIPFNAYILNNDCPYFIKYNDIIKMSSKYLEKFSLPLAPIKYPIIDGDFIKTDSNGAFAKLDIETNKYNLLFSKTDDSDIYGPYIKYKDLGNKVINYNKDLYFNYLKGTDEEIYYCQSNAIEEIFNNGLFEGKEYTDSNGNTLTCKYLYHYNYSYSRLYKNLYNRWVATLLCSCFISILQIFVIIIKFCFCCKRQNKIE